MEGPRKSSRIKNKQLKQASKGSVSSRETKTPKTIKSYPSLKKSKLASLHTPKRGSHKKDDDNDDMKSNLSSKVSFWGSPDLSAVIENLFKLIKLKEDSKFRLISMDLSNIRNMIQLSDQDLNDVTSLFSRQDLRESIFKDSIIKILYLGKRFKLVIKEKHSLEEYDEITGQLITYTFSEDNTFLDEVNMLILKSHDMKCYLQLRKEILYCLEDMMTPDFLVRSTISTTSRKGGSIVSRMSSPRVKSVDTNTYRASESRKTKESSKTSGY
jgi:hypothetical protein